VAGLQAQSGPVAEGGPALTFDRRRVDVPIVYLAERLTLLPGEDESKRAGAAGNRTRFREPGTRFDCGVLVEAAGVELDGVLRIRRVSAFRPRIALAQHAPSADHAFQTPNSAPAAAQRDTANPDGGCAKRHVGFPGHPGSRATESRDLRGQYRPRGIVSREHVFDAQRGQRDVLGRSERREDAEERQFAVGSCVTGGQERSLRCSPRPVNGLFAKPGLQERLIRIHTWLQGGTRGRFMAKVRQKRRPDLGEILRALSNRRSSPAGHALPAASPGSLDRC